MTTFSSPLEAHECLELIALVRAQVTTGLETAQQVFPNHTDTSRGRLEYLLRCLETGARFAEAHPVE